MRGVRAGLCGLSLGVAALAAAPAAADPPAVADAIRRCAAAPGAPVRPAGSVLCFSGDIDRTSAGRAEALLADPAVSAMVIASAGGEARASMRLARAVRARGVLLVVHRHCMSSCANFLFAAARRKAVAERALLVFHGGIAPPAFGGLLGAGEEGALRAEAAAFFRAIGVDERITYDPPYIRDPRSGRRTIAEAWTASPAALARHGIGGILAMWWPGAAAVAAEARARGMALGVME